MDEENINTEENTIEKETSTIDHEPDELNEDLRDYDKLMKENKRLSEELQQSLNVQKQLLSTIEQLQRQVLELKENSFSAERFLKNNKDISFYTGFPSREIFDSVYNFLEPGEKGENIVYWHSTQSATKEFTPDAPKQGRPRNLTPTEEFFLTLCRLRQGFKEEHLSHLFRISQATVSRVVTSWINFMFLKFSVVPLWAPKDYIDLHMPADFKEKYPSTRVVIDCTEISCQMPKSLRLNSELFSNYKNHTTLKALIGISPGGAITFISQLYTGHISDREIVERCGFLSLPFDKGDVIMADKGFTIEDLLPVGCSVNYPPFLGHETQMNPEDVAKTQSIASVRIHVERAINKVKNFHIWDSVVPFTLFGVVNQM